MNFDYLVGYTVAEDKRQGINAHERIIATFDNYTLAEDFVNKVLPAENKHRFFILIKYNNTRITFK